MIEIKMKDTFKKDVRSGDKHDTIRRGRRNWDPGPALIRYEDGDTDLVEITSVEYLAFSLVPPDRQEVLRQFYDDLQDHETMTWISWR